MGVWNRIKSWIPKMTEQVGKVGVWKRWDLAILLQRTKGMKAKMMREEATVEGREPEKGRG